MAYGIIDEIGGVSVQYENQGWVKFGVFNFETGILTKTNAQWKAIFIEIYNASVLRMVSVEFNLFIEFESLETIGKTLTLDLLDSTKTIRDKIAVLGVEYAIPNVIQDEGTMKESPLEYLIKVPSGYKMIKIQYFIDSYRDINPYFYIGYRRGNLQVIKLVAELVKSRIQNGILTRKGFFNGTQTKIF